MTDRKHRVRCRKCRARQTINKHPDAYVRPKRCWSCRSTELVVDKYRDTKREARRQTCTCDGSWYPHRKGSVPLCEHTPPHPPVAEIPEGEEPPF